MEIPEFQDVETLAALCHSHGKEEIKRNFSEVEISDMKGLFYELSKKQDFLESTLGDIATLFKKAPEDAKINEKFQELLDTDFGNKGISTLKKETTALLRKINKGYEVVKETVFNFDFPEINKMGVYSSNGILLFLRPLHISERETASIHSLTGTNN